MLILVKFACGTQKWLTEEAISALLLAGVANEDDGTVLYPGSARFPISGRLYRSHYVWREAQVLLALAEIKHPARLP